MIAVGNRFLIRCSSTEFDSPESDYPAKLGFVKFSESIFRDKRLELVGAVAKSNFLAPVKAMEASRTFDCNGDALINDSDDCSGISFSRLAIFD